MLPGMSRRAVNWGIVAALALVITVLQVVAGTTVTILLLVVRIAIIVGLAYFVYTLWRNNRARLQYVSGRQKLLFYGAGALLVVVLAGSFLITWTFIFALQFFAIIGACAFVMYRIWKNAAGWY